MAVVFERKKNGGFRRVHRRRRDRKLPGLTQNTDGGSRLWLAGDLLTDSFPPNWHLTISNPEWGLTISNPKWGLIISNNFQSTNKILKLVTQGKAYMNFLQFKFHLQRPKSV